MPGPEDPLRKALDQLAAPADPAGAYERIVEKRIRRQIYRRMQVVGLVVLVLAGTIGGTFLLARTFRGSAPQRAAQRPIEQSSIVFFTNRNLPSPLDYRMYRMNPDGTHVREVTEPILSPRDRLSPDGSKIAHSEGISEGRGQIVVANADGSDRRVLTELDNPGGPDWSPDGSTIAFFTNDGVKNAVYVIPAAGGEPTQLTGPPADCGDVAPAWSPDGTQIAFIRDCADVRGSTDIYVMDADGTNQRPLTDGSLTPAGPPVSWSPDGHHIAFVVRDLPSTFQIMVVTLDGTGWKRLTHEGNNVGPTWSPDGKRIAFTSDRDGNEEIYVMNADGTDQRNLTHSPADERNPSWQPVTGRTVEPSESPSESPSPTPEPSNTPSALPPILECATPLVVGDFNGDGLTDTAGVCQPGPRTYSLQVAWGNGATGSVGLPDCREACRAVAAADLNDDGSDEFVLAVDQGASTEFFEVFELPVSEIFGRSAATVAEPGAEGFPAGDAARFAIGGSVTHLDFLTCDTAEDGTRQVVATSAVLDDEQTEYAVHETVFVLDPALESPHGQFVVVSTADSTFPFDPTGEIQPQPRGEPCWDQEAAPTPRSVP